MKYLSIMYMLDNIVVAKTLSKLAKFDLGQTLYDM